MTPPPFLPVSRSRRIHSRLPPLKGKPSKRDEFVLTIPAHSIMDKQLFSRGKKIFHSSRIQRKLLQFGHVQHKSHSQAFFAAIVGIGAAAGERKKKEGARLSWRGRKDFPSSGTFKANLVTARSKNTPGNTTSQSGGRETVTSFSHSASQKHPLATGGKSSSCDSLLVLYSKRFYCVPEVFDICHMVAPTPPALCCHALYIVLSVQEESRAALHFFLFL